MSDMFRDQLVDAQAAEIKNLKAKIAELTLTCRYLNNIYRAAWDIAAKVGCDGAHELTTEETLFLQLYDAMSSYDRNADLRDKFAPIERE